MNRDKKVTAPSRPEIAPETTCADPLTTRLAFSAEEKTALTAAYELLARIARRAQEQECAA